MLPLLCYYLVSCLNDVCMVYGIMVVIVRETRMPCGNSRVRCCSSFLRILWRLLRAHPAGRGVTACHSGLAPHREERNSHYIFNGSQITQQLQRIDSCQSSESLPSSVTRASNFLPFGQSLAPSRGPSQMKHPDTLVLESPEDLVST